MRKKLMEHGQPVAKSNDQQKALRVSNRRKKPETDAAAPAPESVESNSHQKDAPRVGKWTLELWPVSKLKAHPLNWRRHPERQRSVLMQMMERVGWVGVIVVNRQTGHIIDGHLRQEIAQARGAETLVPVFVVDLPKDRELEALATFDTLGYWAEADTKAFADLRVEVEQSMSTLTDEIAAMFNDLQIDAGNAAATAQKTEYWVRVEVTGEAAQKALYDKLTAEGRDVRVLTL